MFMRRKLMSERPQQRRPAEEIREESNMRKLLVSFAAASAIMTTLILAPAQAMTVGTASGLQTALANTSLLEDARYVCHHRFYTSRRVCWWRPGPYHRKWRWRPWRRS
jgi:hypothetical protein